jgi:hypothetical protein
MPNPDRQPVPKPWTGFPWPIEPETPNMHLPSRFLKKVGYKTAASWAYVFPFKKSMNWLIIVDKLRDGRVYNDLSLFKTSFLNNVD